MPLDRQSFEDYLARRGPWLLHVTTADALPAILREGLTPGSERGYSTKDGFFHTRAERVYLCNLLTTAVVEVPGQRALVRVDLRSLDPELLDPDEDHVAESFRRPGGGWVDTAPPDIRELAPAEAGQALARWADETPGFDDPGVTSRSLEAGSVAYRGRIPPGALVHERLPSEVAQFFLDGVRGELGDTLELATVPESGFYKTEIARATELARAVTAEVLRQLGADLGSVPFDWSRYDLVQDIEAALHRLAKRYRDDGALEHAAVISGCADLAQLVADFQPEVGWSSNKDLCATIGMRAAEVIGALKATTHVDVAAQTALTVADAVGAVPDQD